MSPSRRLPVEVARTVLLAFAGLCLMAGRGLDLRATTRPDALWPHLWVPGFYTVAALMAAHAAAIHTRALCIATGLLLHLLVAGRILAAYYLERAASAAGVPTPGASLTAAAFYGTILLATALVWRYLLWPLTDRR